MTRCLFKDIFFSFELIFEIKYSLRAVYITRDSNNKVTTLKLDKVMMKDQQGAMSSYIMINKE